MLLVTHLQITHCYHEQTGETYLGCCKKSELLEDYAKCSGKSYPVNQLSYAKNQNESEMMQ